MRFTESFAQPLREPRMGRMATSFWQPHGATRGYAHPPVPQYARASMTGSSDRLPLDLSRANGAGGGKPPTASYYIEFIV
jgi:hypothetical protein